MHCGFLNFFIRVKDLFNYILLITFFSFFKDEPVVVLSFGSNLNPDNLAEGNDVYFECKIKANPEVYKVVWLHDVSCIFHSWPVLILKLLKIWTGKVKWNPTIFNIIRWVNGTNDSSTKRLMFRALFFFINSYKLRALKTLYFKFCKIIKNKKINWNDFCKEFCKIFM